MQFYSSFDGADDFEDGSRIELDWTRNTLRKCQPCGSAESDKAWSATQADVPRSNFIAFIRVNNLRQVIFMLHPPTSRFTVKGCERRQQ